MSENTYYKEGVPFFIEVEFSDKTDLIERKLIEMGMNHSEILPGLKVNKVFKQNGTELTALYNSMSQDLKDVIDKQNQLMNDFIKKWEIKTDSGENEKHTKMSEASAIVSGYDQNRIKSYDDMSQFPNF